MLNQDDIKQRAARMLMGGVIGLLIGMWAFAILGAFAVLLTVWGTTFWSMVQPMMIGLALVQSLQGLICGAIIGSIIGAFKRTTVAIFAGELGGFIAYGLFFARGVLSSPVIIFSSAIGMIITGIAMVRTMKSVSPTFAQKQMSRFNQNTRVGCFALLALPIALYLLHGMLVVGESYIYQVKWQQKGSGNYTISANWVAFPGIWGNVTVRNGQVVSAKNGDQPLIWALEKYQAFTVDSMFDTIRSYAFKPLYWEVVSYEPEYGYPQNIKFNDMMHMFIPGVEGDVGIRVDELKIE